MSAVKAGPAKQQEYDCPYPPGANHSIGSHILFFLDWELLFEKWPMSQDAFEIHSKRLKTLSNESFESVLRHFEWISNASWDAFEWFPKVSQDALVFIRSVSRRFGIYSKASQDAFEWFIQKRLETFRINTKASWDTLGNHSKASQDAFNIHSKCLKTLSNDLFESVLRRFEWISNASWDVGHFSNKSSQSNKFYKWVFNVIFLMLQCEVTSPPILLLRYFGIVKVALL